MSIAVATRAVTINVVCV
ncbi:hypothetical protein D018_4163A, partial [Vibrio parahaemolyticus VP2007-007]